MPKLRWLWKICPCGECADYRYKQALLEWWDGQSDQTQEWLMSACQSVARLGISAQEATEALNEFAWALDGQFPSAWPE